MSSRESGKWRLSAHLIKNSARQGFLQPPAQHWPTVGTQCVCQAELRQRARIDLVLQPRDDSDWDSHGLAAMGAGLHRGREGSGCHAEALSDSLGSCLPSGT